MPSPPGGDRRRKSLATAFVLELLGSKIQKEHEEKVRYGGWKTSRGGATLDKMEEKRRLR